MTNLTWKKMSGSIAGAIAICVLTGCQGFKSKVYSAAEVKAYQKQLQAEKNRLRSAHPEQAAPAKETEIESPLVNGADSAVDKAQGAAGSRADAAADSSAEAAPSTQEVPVEAVPSLFVEGAEGKILVETDVIPLIETNSQQILEKNSDAVKMVRGLNITVEETPTEGHKLSIDAIVLVGGKIQFLTVDKQPVKYVEAGAVSAFSIVELRETPASTPVAAELKVIVSAACAADVTCTQIQVRMEFGVIGGFVPAIFDVRKGDTGYLIVDSNLKDELRSFEQAKVILDAELAALDPAPAPAQQPSDAATRRHEAAVAKTAREDQVTVSQPAASAATRRHEAAVAKTAREDQVTVSRPAASAVKSRHEAAVAKTAREDRAAMSAPKATTPEPIVRSGRPQ